MRMRRKPWAIPELLASKFFIENPTDNINNWHKLFNNNNPIHLELGCGKGTFIAELASQNTNINYIAIDIKSDVLGNAKRNIEKTYSDKNLLVNNLYIMSQDIQRIDMMLSQEDSIERIYINFCNPWNKPLQYKKRLTHTKQLLLYKTFLTVSGEINFKTDNDKLFEDSIVYFLENGFEIIYKTYDLHNSDYKNNITTEHEDMFTKEGIPTKFLIAKRINNIQ